MVNGFVYVIESPSDTDLLDGRTEGRSLCEALRLADIPHWYSLTTTSSTFEDSLKSRLTEAFSHFQNRSPILHLSMHGNNEGVQLTNGEFLTWADLRKLLTPLTNAMEGGLLICMSSCFGSSGCRMAMHEESDYPFWALIGNTHSATWSDAAVAYITFYHSFFKKVSVKESVQRMCIASGDNNFTVWSGQALKADWTSFVQKNRQDLLAQALRNYTPKNGLLCGPFENSPQENL